MQLSWEALTIDAHDPAACGRWWAETLGWEVASETGYGVEVRPPDGRGASLFFTPVTDAKTVKNRLHLDLYAEDQAAAVVALETRGAERADIGQEPDAACVVMRDPEGNEFCLLEPREP
ncbi:VOC family protein [Pseudonocardia nematodicida]|uniref:VOC family protein n=1 Tax=Pseudonocardia nematodicida TaxID=1206997 RepID=A0ABV1KEU6_9PSEU